MYTIKQLKKMTTERIHKIFTAIYNEILFNPYEEREYMMVTILGSQMSDDEFKGTEERAIVTPDFNHETQSYGVRVYHPTIAKIFAAMNESCLPKRTESKGRKSQFSYRDVWDMLYADIQGVSLKDIAEYFGTTSQMIFGILTGKSYNWASGIPQMEIQ